MVALSSILVSVPNLTRPILFRAMKEASNYLQASVGDRAMHLGALEGTRRRNFHSRLAADFGPSKVAVLRRSRSNGE